MEIKYFGHSSFLIKTKKTRVITDPFDPQIVGLKFPKVEADIVTISHQHQDHNRSDLVLGSPTVFDWPGEFEKMSVRIFGFNSYHDKEKGAKRGENIIFKIEAEGITVVHCGDLGLVPDNNFLEKIGNVDILLVPVGGFYTIDASEAYDLVKKIEPVIVIPMHYNNSKLNQKFFSNLTLVEEFTKKFGIEKPEVIPKFVYKKEEEKEEMRVVVLEIG